VSFRRSRNSGSLSRDPFRVPFAVVVRIPNASDDTSVHQDHARKLAGRPVRPIRGSEIGVAATHRASLDGCGRYFADILWYPIGTLSSL
jgi:hypothetical protein